MISNQVSITTRSSYSLMHRINARSTC